MDLQAIPSNLAKYGPEIVAGQAATDRRRKELANAWGYPPQKPAGPAEYIKNPQPQPVIISSDPQGVKPGPIMDLVMPQVVQVYGGLNIAAWQANQGGAYRLYILAKALDQAGSGAIKKSDLKAAIDNLGVNERNYWRWLADAEKIGLFVRWSSLPNSFVLVNHAKAAAILFNLAAIAWTERESKAEKPQPLPEIYGRLEKYRAEIPLKSLYRKGWRGVIYQAFYKSHFEKRYTKKRTDNKGGIYYTQATHFELISQEKLSQLTGIAVSTQRLLQKGMKITPNYAITNIPAELLPAAKEFKTMAAPQAFYDMRTEKNVISERLPDKRKAPKNINFGSVGRSRKIQKYLNNPNQDRLCFLVRPAKFEDGKVSRVMYAKHQAEKALRILQSTTRLKADPQEIFTYWRKAKHTNTTLFDSHNLQAETMC